MSTPATKNPPIKALKLGLVEASIFQNEGQKGSFYSVTVQRRYQDEQGQWQSSNACTAAQLAHAIAVMQRALDFMLDQAEAE